MNGQVAGTTSAPWWQVLLIGRRPARTLLRALVLAVICLAISKYVLMPIRVEGISMLPTYGEKGVNFVNRLAYIKHGPERGDVVAIRLAGPHVMYMKRVIGLPGESISFHKGKVYIDGEKLEELYLKLPCDWEAAAKLIGPDQYYVVGDNRSMAMADHTQGIAERFRILGKVVR